MSDNIDVRVEVGIEVEHPCYIKTLRKTLTPQIRTVFSFEVRDLDVNCGMNTIQTSKNKTRI
jgi:hypothetical protein